MLRRALILALSMVALASCSGGTSCTKVMVPGGGHIECSGSLDRLTGKQVVAFDLEDMVVGASISAKISIQVSSGTLKVSYEDVEGRSVVYLVSPSKPLTVVDEMQVAGNQAQVTFDSEAATASGINYSAEFTE